MSFLRLSESSEGVDGWAEKFTNEQRSRSERGTREGQEELKGHGGRGSQPASAAAIPAGIQTRRPAQPGLAGPRKPWDPETQRLAAPQKPNWPPETQSRWFPMFSIHLRLIMEPTLVSESVLDLDQDWNLATVVALCCTEPVALTIVATSWTFMKRFVKLNVH